MLGVIPWLGLNAKLFALGWAEGHVRAHSKNAPDVIPGSMYDQGTVEFAASQASVAFFVALKGD